MARATNKSDLLLAARTQYDQLCILTESMTQDEQTATFHFSDSFNKKEAHWSRDKNLRDVLVHLYEWHQLLLKWVSVNLSGKATTFLPEPYNWKTYGQMNLEFWNKHQTTSYEDSKQLLNDSHNKVINMIEQLSNEELFEKKHFSWTGTSPLGSYCVSSTSSHYDWAMKKIKQHIKAYRATK